MPSAEDPDEVDNAELQFSAEGYHPEELIVEPENAVFNLEKMNYC